MNSGVWVFLKNNFKLLDSFPGGSDKATWFQVIKKVKTAVEQASKMLVVLKHSSGVNVLFSVIRFWSS